VGSYNNPYTYGKPGEFLPTQRVGYSTQLPIDRSATGNSYPEVPGRYIQKPYPGKYIGRFDRLNDPSNFEHFPYGGIFGAYQLPNLTVYGRRRYNNIPIDNYPVDYRINNRSTYPQTTPIDNANPIPPVLTPEERDAIYREGADRVPDITTTGRGADVLPGMPNADVPSVATPPINPVAGEPIVVKDPVTGEPVVVAGAEGSTKGPKGKKSPKDKNGKSYGDPSDIDWSGVGVNALGLLAGYNQYVRGKKG
jgi:hypothetical protein